MGRFTKIMPDHEYHSIEALSASGIKKLLQSPAHFKVMRDQVNEPTPAMVLGTATHMAVLERERFATDVVIAPEAKKTTKEGKAEWAEFEKANEGKLILKQSDYDDVIGMRDAVFKSPQWSRNFWLMEGISEVSLFWENPTYKVPCKARFDRLFEEGIIFDLKTCVDASPKGVVKAIANFQYHVQAAFYLDAYREVFKKHASSFVFCFVEKEPPYGVAYYVLTEESIRGGYAKVDAGLRLYQEALRTNEWHGYEPQIQLIDLPQWGL